MMTRRPTSTAACANRASRASRAQQGFSLAETMIATLIVLMVSIIVATGAPAAINAYHQAVASSNAQVALSTVATALRDELGAATAVRSTGETVEYVCGGGYWAKISNGTKGPMKTADDDRLAEENGKSWELVPNAQLAATQGDLYAKYGTISFENGVFKVANLRVEDEKGNVLARIGDRGTDFLAVRASYCTDET